MLFLFVSLKDRFKYKYVSHCIDNWVFQLHYRATTTIFLIATILVTSKEYIGEHMKCINDLKDKDVGKVIETYCFFTSTFTIPNNTNSNFEEEGLLGYLRSSGPGKDKVIKKHLYYQWVPFLLFGQAIMFYLTHLLWKNLEGGRIKQFVAGLNHSRFALSTSEVTVGKEKIPSKEDVAKCINRIKEAFYKRIIVNKSWARWLIFCEVLNVLHILLEYYIIHLFIGRKFYSLGTDLMKQGYEVLNQVFPKAAKCTFHKYGASGTIQNHDALCILALNIINEKIYVFLWFWFIFLSVASCLSLVWRFCSVMFYKNSIAFNQIIFGKSSCKKLYAWHLNMIAKHFTYSDWLLLKYLSKNIDAITFTELFVSMSEDLEETKPLFIDLKEIKRR